MSVFEEDCNFYNYLIVSEDTHAYLRVFTVPDVASIMYNVRRARGCQS